MKRLDPTSADRARRHRERRKRGRMIARLCVPIDFYEICIHRGIIAPEDLEDAAALQEKVGAAVDELLWLDE